MDRAYFFCTFRYVHAWILLRTEKGILRIAAFGYNLVLHVYFEVQYLGLGLGLELVKYLATKVLVIWCHLERQSHVLRKELFRRHLEGGGNSKQKRKENPLGGRATVTWGQHQESDFTDATNGRN